jgi:hypothetical protein
MMMGGGCIGIYSKILNDRLVSQWYDTTAQSIYIQPLFFIVLFYNIEVTFYYEFINILLFLITKYRQS